MFGVITPARIPDRTRITSTKILEFRTCTNRYDFLFIYFFFNCTRSINVGRGEGFEGPSSVRVTQSRGYGGAQTRGSTIRRPSSGGDGRRTMARQEYLHGPGGRPFARCLPERILVDKQSPPDAMGPPTERNKNSYIKSRHSRPIRYSAKRNFGLATAPSATVGKNKRVDFFRIFFVPHDIFSQNPARIRLIRCIRFVVAATDTQ